MKIATWNVNSIKVRIPHLVEWVKQADPDVVLLQELKTTEDQFPKMAVDELGYNMADRWPKNLQWRRDPLQDAN